MAEMKCLVFEIRGFHLNRKMIDAKLGVQFSTQIPKQLRRLNGLRMDYVRAESVATRGNCPDVQVVDFADTRSLQNCRFDSGEIDMRRRALE